jgi:tRNA dimethylallyltransferase
LSTQLPAADCWFVTGPTAAGKTRVGVALAERFRAAGPPAEILSLDSMAIYRGMDIGTAKPSPEDRARVPHHLLDIREPHEEFSLAQYVEAAEQLVLDIRGRGAMPIFVGGTPLYLKALLRGMFEGPPADWAFRQQVDEEVTRVGVEALHKRLAMIDPLSAAKLKPTDKRRIIRALEVYKLTGQPISHLQLQFDVARPAEACKVFVLHWPRPELHRRIEARVEAMFEAGLIDEVRRLRENGGALSRTALQAVGYAEVLAHLDGKLDLAETIRLVKTRTRQFAKRQETWFRSLSECRWIEMHEPLDAEQVAAEIAHHERRGVSPT